jgi:hypothetical protein
MAKKQVEVTEKNFLNWYFSDYEDVKTFSKDAIESLYYNGVFKITSKELFDSCGYIPAYICENGEEDEEYDPSELKFVVTRKNGKCHSCGEEYDFTMDDFCSKCLALK